MEESRNEMMEMFDCEDVGNLDEYVGCKVRREEGCFTFTQPVMLKSFEDDLIFQLEYQWHQATQGKH